MRGPAHTPVRRYAGRARCGPGHARATSGFGRFFVLRAAALQREHARIR